MNIEPQRGGRTKSLKGKPSERGDGTQTRRSKKSDYGSQTRLKDFVALSLIKRVEHAVCEQKRLFMYEFAADLCFA